MNQIAIGFHYEGSSTDDHYGLLIVESEKPKPEMIQEINDLWPQFQATHPDTDDQFGDYLAERGYKVLDNSPTLLVLDG
tara:strand:- start:19012 stop:19248 length:237 start_codon:yes stop_codon:yes gene_type:complete